MIFALTLNFGWAQLQPLPTITDKRFQDSCIFGVATFLSVVPNTTPSTLINYGKTITNPIILTGAILTSTSSFAPAFSYATTVTSTSCYVGVFNLGVLAYDFKVNYRICPNNGVGY